MQLAVQPESKDDPARVSALSVAVGTRLMREGNGRKVDVIILEHGYLFEDRL